MKRLVLIAISVLTALCLVLSLAACGNDGGSTPTSVPATEAAQSGSGVTDADLTFVYNGVNVELNGDAQALIAAIGEDYEESSQLSCHGEGDDKTYKFNGFIINTYPLDGEDRVLEVVINGEGIATSKGIGLGASVDEVTSTYGDGYRKVGMYYAYEAADGKRSLQFFIENDTVKEIDYYYSV